MKLTEDDLYRQSSQYKHWSFTPTGLALLRQKTNIQACERVKANVARQRAQRTAKAFEGGGGNSASDSERANTPGVDTAANGNGNGGANGGGDTRVDREVKCLSVAEEMRLVDKFCETTLDLATFLGAPSDVTATAIQFLRRFYIYNSPMTYDALIISRTITFIACKTDNHTLTLDEYVSKLGHGTRDEILAPEHLIVQALRFNFEVRHPFRGLKGVFLELGEMAKGTTPGWTPMPWDSRSKADIQTAMLQVPRMMEDDERGGTMMSEKEVQKRLDHSYSHAAHILKTTAQLTDAYFLYTPSQLLHAALLLADEPLLLFYLSTKLLPSSRIYKKSLMVIRSCSVLFASHRSFTATSSSIPAEEKAAQKEQANAEVKLLMKKLKQCRDPDKIDLVKLNQAQKRDAVSGGGALDENKAKRRKIAREGAEKESDEFWGPEIKKS